MNVWLDDVRKAPEGWIWAKSVADVQRLFAEDVIESLHLDHDVGYSPETGYNHNLPTGSDLAQWMVNAQRFPSKRIVIHSINRNGRLFMLERLSQEISEKRIPVVLSMQPLPDSPDWESQVPKEWI